MADLREYFDRVFVINLDRRPDRHDDFIHSLRRIHWPFKEPERYPAVDGDALGVPNWWRQGGGAWGCLMSHARILEDCVRDQVERVLILEDDAVFVEDFAERIEPFLEHVPQDWDQLYLGGQHLRDPMRENDHVYRCLNVNRTHCYGVSRKFMSRMYRFILNAQDYMANPGHHIDHRLGALQESGTVKVFSPVDWLVGQSGNRSDISGRSSAPYFWNTWAGVPEMPMTVVLGLHHGYGSEVAGLMKDLGVHFGHRLGGYEGPQVEDVGLSAICERVFPFPTTTRCLSREDSGVLVHDWCRLILQEAADYGTGGAACYPHLCAMHEDFSAGWKNLRVVDVRCEFAEAVANLQYRSRTETGWLRIGANEVVKVQEFLEDGRREWISNCRHLTVNACDLRDDPVRVASALREFLELKSHSGRAASAESGAEPGTRRCA